MTDHERYMRRCLELAERGRGKVSPNPMVGCVIVHEDKVIGEGWHKEYGGPHAEVDAIASVKDPLMLKRSTLYVNLEPCSHYGKTPPCADLIMEHKIPYVVIGCLDPNPKVGGMGIRKLASAGIDVKLGVLESESRKLNHRFIFFHEHKRPYIILKWAETADGYIGAKGKRTPISGLEAIKLVHHWRSEEAGIWVGTNTAIIDDPELTVREVEGRSPLRISMDRQNRFPSDLKLINGKVPALIFTQGNPSKLPNVEYVQLSPEKWDLKHMLDVLYNKGIISVLVEGGPGLHRSFLESGVWDEVRIIRSSRRLEELVPGQEGLRPVSVEWKGQEVRRSGSDQVVVMKRTS